MVNYDYNVILSILAPLIFFIINIEIRWILETLKASDICADLYMAAIGIDISAFSYLLSIKSLEFSSFFLFFWGHFILWLLTLKLGLLTSKLGTEQGFWKRFWKKLIIFGPLYCVGVFTISLALYTFMRIKP